MFKTLKKKPEKVKEKVDYKFRFHATRVPLAGWDKLVVSLIRVETGKAVIKTPRTIVRNGNCQWLDSVIESTSLVQDVKTLEYEEKPYKLVVSMGSSRSGILGDATINLADYALSNDPAEIVLSLANCNAGTLLHVNIQCITPRASMRPPAFVHYSSRDLSERSDLSVDHSDQESASDEDLDDSDACENNTQTSMPPSGSMSAVPSFMKPTVRTSSPSQIIFKDVSSSPLLRYSSDSLEVPSTPSSVNDSGRSYSNADTSSSASSASSLPGHHTKNASKERNDKTGVHQDAKSPAVSSGRTIPSSNNSMGQGQKNIWQDLHGRPTTSEKIPHSHPVTHNGAQSSLQTDLEAAEITIEELRSESIMWQRQAHKLGLEADTLKQKLGLHIKQGAEAAAEKSALTVERDRLKLELDQLQYDKKASQEREDGEDHANRKAEDTKRMMKEMEEEIAYQKEVNLNLKVQLQKTQDSSMELVLAIKDLEETLDEQKGELDHLKAINAELKCAMFECREESRSVADVEKSWKEQLSYKDQEVKGLQAKLVTVKSAVAALRPGADGYNSLQALQQKVEKLQNELEEVENERNEVTNDDAELYTNFRKASEDLKATSEMVVPLQAELKTNMQVCCEQPEEPSKLGAIVDELNDDDHLATTLGVGNRPSKDVLSMGTEPQTECLQVENKVTGTYQQSLGSVMASIEGLSCRRNMMLGQQQLTSFEDNVVKLEGDHFLALRNLNALHIGALEKIEFQEQELAAAKETVQELLVFKAQAEQSMHALDRERLLLIERLRASQESRDEAAKVVHAREVEAADHLQEVAVHEAANRELALKVTKLEDSHTKLEAKLWESLENSRLIESQFQDVTIRLRKALLKVAEVESSKAESDTVLHDAQEAGRLNWSCIEELQVHLSRFAEELEPAQSFHMKNEPRLSDSESQKGELDRQLNTSISKRKVIAEQADLLVHEVDSLRKQLDMLLVVKRNSEKRLSELESIKSELELQLSALERKNFHNFERISELEAQLKYVTQEGETYKLGREDAGTQDAEKNSKDDAANVSAVQVLTTLQDELEQTAEEALKVSIVDKTCRREDMLRLTGKMALTMNEKDKFACQALVEGSELRAENSKMEERFENMEKNYRTSLGEVLTVEGNMKQMHNELYHLRARGAGSQSMLETSRKQLEMLGQSDHIGRGKLEEELDGTLECLATENGRLAGDRDHVFAVTQEIETSKDIMRLETALEKAIGDKNMLQATLEAAHVDLLTVHEENHTLAKSLAQALADVEDMERCRGALEEELLRLQLELDAQEAARSCAAEQRAESFMLTRENNDFRRQLTICESEKEIFCRKLQVLEGELQCSVSALEAAQKKLKESDEYCRLGTGGTFLPRSLSRSSSKVGPMSPSMETTDVVDMRGRVKCFEVELRSKISTQGSAKWDFQENETLLVNRIEMLELANEQPAQGGPGAGLDQLQMEVHRLQTQNSILACREQGLLSELGAQDFLRSEVKRLQQRSEQLEKKLMRFKEATKSGNVLEKLFTLEMELTETLEANNMYKSQLRSAFAEQQNVHAAALQNLGDVDQVIGDLLMFKKQATTLQEELKEMRERYSRMSLQFAEVEAQREELVMSMRTLKNSKKL